jgi:hypothetical protein
VFRAHDFCGLRLTAGRERWRNVGKQGIFRSDPFRGFSYGEIPGQRRCIARLGQE